ncbi:uncharacterized protein L3040_006610 [Drepanopeziza brunnea f. sp. 'multigermtubi']|uniref:uncharacterized protein n=1 Tax=Drepanopeziza brunnea f. sp. 'multigermtubi' TaxID=698441 RepID=UPI002395C8BD|nr:hypothetical protein L3040_006610 [Drepanopeziza brunnea f. sp. 'multigermtubi']
MVFSTSTHPSAPSTASIDIDGPPDLVYKGVYVANKPDNTLWDVAFKNGHISALDEHKVPDQEHITEKHHDGDHHRGTKFLCPSLCHPHIHLDKCFLLSHPKYSDLEIKDGDFAEAMKLTSRRGKAQIRGVEQAHDNISRSSESMRAFVEVDLVVQMKCLDAGLALKEKFQDRIYMQICVFAQDPIVSYGDNGKAMMELLEVAANRHGVSCFGSTPYVEKDGDRIKQLANIEFAIKTAMRCKLHLDFHIDYNLDPNQPSMVGETIELLHKMKWPTDCNEHLYRSIIFSHCSRLTLFSQHEWLELRRKILGLPVSFIGLPNSDLFMMGRPGKEDVEQTTQRVRGTLQVLDIIQRYAMNAAIGINNVGNAFTPHGSCDPLSLASFGVGVYQASTKKELALMLQCVSHRAKTAIGIRLTIANEIDIDVGDEAHFIIFGNENPSRPFRTRKTIQDVVCDPSRDRTTIYKGKVVSNTSRESAGIGSCALRGYGESLILSLDASRAG